MSAAVTATTTSVSGPYVGLRNFTEDHAPFFFGRDEERKGIIGNLQVARFTLLYAESGVGKSSLLRAGVIPRLRELAAQARADDDPSFDVPVIFSSWTASPTEALISEIEAATRPWTEEPIALPRDSLEQAIVAATDAIGANLIVVLDQFEEYVSNQARVGTDDAFPEQLAECLNASGLRASFLVSIREDAYARVGELLKSRVPNVYANYLHLDYLDEDEAARRDRQAGRSMERTTPRTTRPTRSSPRSSTPS